VKAKKLQLSIAIAWGILLGSLTFAVRPISTISANFVLGAIQKGTMVLLLPGLIGSAAVAGNVHAFSLVPAAIINALFHFGIAWLLIRIKVRRVAPA